MKHQECARQGCAVGSTDGNNGPFCSWQCRKISELEKELEKVKGQRDDAVRDCRMDTTTVENAGNSGKLIYTQDSMPPIRKNQIYLGGDTGERPYEIWGFKDNSVILYSEGMAWGYRADGTDPVLPLILSKLVYDPVWGDMTGWRIVTREEMKTYEKPQGAQFHEGAGAWSATAPSREWDSHITYRIPEDHRWKEEIPIEEQFDRFFPNSEPDTCTYCKRALTDSDIRGYCNEECLYEMKDERAEHDYMKVTREQKRMYQIPPDTMVNESGEWEEMFQDLDEWDNNKDCEWRQDLEYMVPRDTDWSWLKRRNHEPEWREVDDSEREEFHMPPFEVIQTWNSSERWEHATRSVDWLYDMDTRYRIRSDYSFPEILRRSTPTEDRKRPTACDTGHSGGLNEHPGSVASLMEFADRVPDIIENITRPAHAEVNTYRYSHSNEIGHMHSFECNVPGFEKSSVEIIVGSQVSTDMTIYVDGMRAFSGQVGEDAMCIVSECLRRLQELCMETARKRLERLSLGSSKYDI
jgi:hypothetical protein